MIQIFICSTPYHVLLAHLSIEFLDKHENTNKTKRILILTESAIANSINEIIYEQTWNRTLFLPYQKPIHIYKTKRFIDNWIIKNGLSNLSERKEIFINDDQRWRNQLLITGIQPDKISLIEDGLGAYVKNTYSLRNKIYRGVILKSIFRNRLLNTRTISSIPADQFFAFRQSAYSWFGPNRILHKLNYKKSKYIEKVGQKQFIKEQKEKINSAELIILTSPLVEDRILSIEEELNAWREFALLFLHHPETIAIKPHPREHENIFKQRIAVMSEIFKNSKISLVDSILPAEFLLCNEELQAEIFGPNSTTLANLKSIRSDLKIHHGCDLFFSDTKVNSSMKRLAGYLNQLGVSSILKRQVNE